MRYGESENSLKQELCPLTKIKYQRLFVDEGFQFYLLNDFHLYFLFLGKVLGNTLTSKTSSLNTIKARKTIFVFFNF